MNPSCIFDAYIFIATACQWVLGPRRRFRARVGAAAGSAREGGPNRGRREEGAGGTDLGIGPIGWARERRRSHEQDRFGGGSGDVDGGPARVRRGGHQDRGRGGGRGRADGGV